MSAARAPIIRTLRLAGRDVRVTARRERRSALRGACPSFVAMLTDRLAFHRLPLRILEMILRRNPRAHRGSSFIDASVHVHVAPQLALNLVKLNRTDTHVKWQPATAPAPLLIERQIFSRTVQRLVDRETRLERVVSISRPAAQRSKDHNLFSSGSSTQPPAAETMHPDMRVFRRVHQTSAVAKPEMETAELPTHPGASQMPQPPEARAPRRNETVSALELKRITDHVVQAIDRRIIAGRERRGKG